MTSQKTSSIPTNPTLATNQKAFAIPAHIPRYIIYAGLGGLGGATSVAVVIGASIVLVLLAPPPVTFSPGIIPLALTAVVIGLGISWLLRLVALRLWPGIFHQTDKQVLQVIFICSALTSLLESLHFGQGL